MLKLTQEQQQRTHVEDKLEDAMVTEQLHLSLFR